MRKKPGRPSAADLTIVPLAAIPQRPPPPDDLTPRQAALWRATVAARPADYFGPASHPLLAAYCRHVATTEALAVQLDKQEAAEGFDVERYDTLLRLREREVRAVSALARAMRLTHQSRFDRKAAALHQNHDGLRPWER